MRKAHRGQAGNGVQVKFPQWSEERMRDLAETEPDGLMACSPELLTEFKEQAKTDMSMAAKLFFAGVELDPETVARWWFGEKKENA